MRTFVLRSGPETAAASPVIRVHRQGSVLFILAAAQRRGLHATHVHHEAAGYDVTIAGTADQVEEVRKEFNQRPLAAQQYRKRFRP